MCVNVDQAFLGRCYFALNRHETDVTALTQEERDSLWALLGRAKAAIDKLFSPEHYNYVFLMNVDPHVHMHIIPRYAAQRQYGGRTFRDIRFGGQFDPQSSYVLPDEFISDLASAIREALPK